MLNKNSVTSKEKTTIALAVAINGNYRVVDNRSNLDLRFTHRYAKSEKFEHVRWIWKNFINSFYSSS